MGKIPPLFGPAKYWAFGHKRGAENKKVEVMYAVIATGGKQYRVNEGDCLRVEKLTGSVGEKVVFDKVLLTGGDGEPKIGTPMLNGAKVEAEITAQDRAKKIVVFKFKRRKNYRRKYGHRQPYTELKITKIKG
jgi:large subunit ribosomal protein L21